MKEPLSDSIATYNQFRSSLGLATSSLRSERTVLRQFLTVTGNIYTWNVTDTHVTRFFEQAQKTRSANTLMKDHSYLSTFFEWCRRSKRMGLDNDPMFGRRPPKKMQRERSRVPASKFPALLDAAEATGGPRDRALISMLLYTLGRDQEIATLRIRDVDLDGGWIHYVVHKTRQEDTLPVSLELDRELRRWLTAYTTLCGPLQPHWYLVPAYQAVASQRGPDGMFTAFRRVLEPEKVLPQSANRVKPVLAAIGQPAGNGEGAHTIRRSGARALFDALSASGHDYALRIVQSMLHHSTITTTEIYIGVTADRRTRDQIIRGHAMYPMGEVTQIRAVK